MLKSIRVVLSCCWYTSLSLLAADRKMLGGLAPTRQDLRKSMINKGWSPTPYPTGITHAPTTVTSDVAHTPSIGVDPQKYVAPTFWHVNPPTTSDIASPSLSISFFPMLFLYIFLFVSIQIISRSPSSHHCFSCAIRYSQKRFLGHVLSFCFVIKNCRCCWYNVFDSFLLL